jgi:DNA-binding MarR family transcriptional regulator
VVPSSELSLFPSWFGQPGQGPGARPRLLQLSAAEGAKRDEAAAVFDHIRDVALRMTVARDNIVAAAGLTVARVILLERIHRVQPDLWTIAEHARHLGRARQSVRRVALALEGIGLIERRRKRGARAARLLALTDDGFDWLCHARFFEHEWIAGVVCYYAPRDVQQACWMLRALRQRTGTTERDF